MSVVKPIVESGIGTIKLVGGITAYRLPNPQEAIYLGNKKIFDLALAQKGHYVGGLSIIAHRDLHLTVGEHVGIDVTLHHISGDEFLKRQKITIVKVKSPKNIPGLI